MKSDISLRVPDPLTAQRPEVLAIIPARSGSKSIVNKNIRIIGGKPLIAHSVQHALAAASVTRTIVSTDSLEYANIAKEYGAEVPFLRPSEFAGDSSTDLEVFEHALGWLRSNEGYTPSICVHLRPTHPIRDPKDIDKMVAILMDDPGLDSVRSVVLAPETPFKMWFRDQAGRLCPVITTDIKEAYNQPRQYLPKTYLQNASIDVLRTRVVIQQRSMNGRNIHGYVMDAIFDIDDDSQFERAALEMAQLSFGPKAPQTSKTFVFDIDGIVATLVPSLDYGLAGPNREIIDIINFLHDQGHRIVLFTARGSLTGRDWFQTTARQLSEWKVRHHELTFGKPAADYYIDDKFLPLDELKRLAKTWGMS